MTRKKAAPAPVAAPETVLVLRTCAADMTAYNGAFTWPESGPVACGDWDPAPRCGGGLHGLLWGEGDGGLVSWAEDARWLVVEVPADTVVPIDAGAKVKFPAGTVVFCGTRLDATAFLVSVRPGAVVGAVTTAGDRGTATAGYLGTATAGEGGTATAGEGGTATAGDRGTATAGDRGTATAGYRGTATAGYRGTATAGEGGTATAGYRGTATAGYRGTATAGYRGTATAGDRGTATAGYRGTATAGEGGTATAGEGGTATAGESGTATAGDRGTATAGESGTATAGEGGTATAGESGTATAGESGAISIKWWDRSCQRYRLVVGYVGEEGIEPDRAYRVSDEGKLVAVEAS